MWFALALRMGYPLAILKKIMSHAEFRQWCAYFENNPFDDRSNFQIPSALTRALLANLNRNPKTRPSPFGYSDFMPFDVAADEPVATPKDILAILQGARI